MYCRRVSHSCDASSDGGLGLGAECSGVLHSEGVELEEECEQGCVEERGIRGVEEAEEEVWEEGGCVATVLWSGLAFKNRFCLAHNKSL